MLKIAYGGIAAIIALLAARGSADAASEEGLDDGGGIVPRLPAPPAGECVVSGESFDAFVDKATGEITRCWEQLPEGFRETEPLACFADRAFPDFFTCEGL